MTKKKSGLDSTLGISSVVSSDDLRAQYLDKRVRYKNPDPDRDGTISLKCDFVVREVQLNYKVEPVLRGYAIDRETGMQIDTFGRPFGVDEVEII